MKYKSTIFFSIFNFSFFISFSQGNSLLWRISGNGLSKPSYLYGTMHTRDARAFHFADSVWTVFEMCDAFAMEVVMDEHVMGKLMNNLYMDTSYSLKNLLSPQQYDSLEEYCRKNTGQSIDFFNRIKPIYTSVMLMEEVFDENDSLHEKKEQFLDLFLQQQANHQQKQVFGLETAEEQLKVFDLLNYKDQAQLLMKSIRASETDSMNLETMIQYYMNNDLYHMMQFENDYSLPDSLFNALFTDRNHRMANKIDTMIQSRAVFIAVGAGHLGEEKGLVNLLREKGYTIVPVIPSYTNYREEGWVRFVSQVNQFTCLFPDPPEIHTFNDFTQYICGNSSCTAVVIQGFNVSILSNADSLESFLKKNISKQFGKLKIKETGATYIEFTGVLPAPHIIRVHGRIYYRNSQAIIIYSTSMELINSKKNELFLDSFQFLP